jgi:cyclic-di-GMP-binding protein
MPALDIVNKIDAQTLDNVVNVVKKEITTRYDFRDSKTEIDLDKKNNIINILTENEMRIEAIEDVLRSRMIKQKLDPLCLDFAKQRYASGSMMKKELKIKEGIDKENAKKIIKIIKDSKLKVEAQQMDEQVRVTGKKIDDLQAVMAVIRSAELEIPVQFTNFK